MADADEGAEIADPSAEEPAAAAAPEEETAEAEVAAEEDWPEAEAAEAEAWPVEDGEAATPAETISQCLREPSTRLQLRQWPARPPTEAAHRRSL